MQAEDQQQPIPLPVQCLAVGALQGTCRVEVVRDCSGSQHPGGSFASEETPWPGSLLECILGFVITFDYIHQRRRRTQPKFLFCFLARYKPQKPPSILLFPIIN